MTTCDAKLLPCPFCSARAHWINWAPKRGPYSIGCQACYAQTCEYETADEAVEAWSQRAYLALNEKQRAVIEAARRASEYGWDECGIPLIDAVEALERGSDE